MLPEVRVELCLGIYVQKSLCLMQIIPAPNEAGKISKVGRNFPAQFSTGPQSQTTTKLYHFPPKTQPFPFPLSMKQENTLLKKLIL